ncbi:ankyrin [Colletotrichum eremochloae]|nr:ankyrin [Colletotrichum eremochloae]
MAMLDHRHPDLHKPTTDNNAYTLGSIGKHMIVIVCLPKGQIGNNSAATVATRMVSTFPAVRFCFMAGIGGGVPSKVRLGDVVVSTPTGQNSGVVQWDFGKAEGGDRFERTGALNNPPGFILTALSKLESVHEMEGSKMTGFLEDLGKKWPRLAPKYQRSDSLEDVLFKADYNHIAREAGDVMDEEDEEVEGKTCQFCDKAQAKKRKPRNTRIHYGLIASGNKVVKDGTFRDNLNKSLGGKVLCIDMEAAGLMTSFPCLVIRGICDYVDSHKDKQWQEHAAAVAAAFAKELLGYIEPHEVEEQRAAKETLQELVVARESNVERLRHHIQSGEDMKALEWLAPFDYGLQQSDLLGKCHPGTGQWLLGSGEFSKWECSPRGTALLCTGIPGAGKTIITSLVVNHLCTQYGEALDVGIAYIYCNFRRHYQQQYADILASLLKQLCQTQPALPDAQKTRPSSIELTEALKAVVQLYSRTFILIDALDECQSLNGTRSEILSHLFRMQNESATHLFFTSRHVPDVLQRFEDCARLEAVPETPGLLKEIREKVLTLADGMFLLAHLYVESLRDKTSATEIRAAIGTAARQNDGNSKDKRQHALYQAYNDAMTRIEEQSPGFRDLGMKTLAWIVHAERPLSTMELQHALAIREGDTNLDYDNLRKIEVILSVCAGMVTVDQESDVVRLIHYTAQEYFDANGTRTKTWGHHARKGSGTSPAVHNFLANEVNIRVSCQAILFPKEEFIFPRKHAKSWTAMHMVAFFDLQDVVKTLVKNGEQIDSYNETMYSPLFIASCKGHKTIVRFLLASGARVDGGRDYRDRTPLFIASEFGRARLDSKDNGGASSLHAACRTGYVGVCKLLIERGAHVKARDRERKTPLHHASLEGHQAVYKFGQTPLHIASLQGHQDVCRLLLNMGANPDAKGHSGMTKSYEDDLEIIEC